MTMSLHIEPFYDQTTCTWSYVISDNQHQVAAVIDPVLDFDLSSGLIQSISISKIINYINHNNLALVWILETHAHADHLTAAQLLKDTLGGQIAIGQGITDVQAHFSHVFNSAMPTDGSQFDLLLSSNQELTLGNHSIKIHPTPGHTNDSVSYQISDNIFIGDTFFHPDTGTARCDFPGGDAKKLFQSLQFLLSFPDHYKLWLCHDYPNERAAVACTSVAQQKSNIHLVNSQQQEDLYIQLRQARDEGLTVPKLIYPSIQVNICAGQLPAADTNNVKYLKIPLNIKK